MSKPTLTVIAQQGKRLETIEREAASVPRTEASNALSQAPADATQTNDEDRTELACIIESAGGIVELAINALENGLDETTVTKALYGARRLLERAFDLAADFQREGELAQ